MMRKEFIIYDQQTDDSIMFTVAYRINVFPMQTYRYLIKAVMIIAVLIYFPSISYGQRGIAASHKFAIDYQMHSGYVVFKTGDTVHGTFEYAEWEFPSWNLKYYNFKGQVVHHYRSKVLKKAVLKGSDRLLTGHDSTYFIVDDKHNWFFRQLTFGKVQIFDSFFDAGERLNLVKPPYLVITAGQSLYFDTDDDLLKWFAVNYKSAANKSGVNDVSGIIASENHT